MCPVMASPAPTGLWQLALPGGQHTSAPEHFHTVMTTLLHSPNVTSSLLFRAEILYDSDKDHTASWSLTNGFQSQLIGHMKFGLRPRALSIDERGQHDLFLPSLDREASPGKHWNWRWQRTVVRNLVPRNPQRDSPLVQSCWYLECSDEDENEEQHLVIYIPHVDSVEQVPFFHPSVQALAMLYTWIPYAQSPELRVDESHEDTDGAAHLPSGNGSLRIFYSYFPSSEVSNRLSRTALNLQSTIIKHMAGRAAGYVKRVHHDRIIPQKAFQDTYTRLKLKYAPDLVKGWAEQTDPAKHVFEDLGIAAFLIELWKEMYGSVIDTFPGFVDVGCGNGLLVYLLRSEGYEGWGFDLRQRKTWNNLPQDIVGGKLKEMACVPKILLDSVNASAKEDLFLNSSLQIHDGIFPRGTFIISNHADELTAWTPLLAHLSRCPFVAIPCCSHDFGGRKFRAKAKTVENIAISGSDHEDSATSQVGERKNAAEIGSLRKQIFKPPSAYAALCTWLEYLTAECGVVPEKETLRIPSTRNAAVVGRKHIDAGSEHAFSSIDAERRIRALVEKEMTISLNTIAQDWIERTKKIA